MDMVMLGTIGKPLRMKCGGWTDCDTLHDTYTPQQTVLVHDAMSLEDLRACDDWSAEKEAKAVANGTVLVEKDYVVPTMLGHWYDEVSSN